MLTKEERKLWQRREKLKLLLQGEEQSLLQELLTKQSMKDCDYCKERESKLKKYEEEIEKEKIIACKRALEREKMWVFVNLFFLHLNNNW